MELLTRNNFEGWMQKLMERLVIAGKENKFEGLNENYVIVDNWFVQIPYAVYTGE